MRNFASLTRMRIKLALRNRMFFFFSVVFPLGMFFLYAGIFAKGNPRVVSFFLGPVIALNVMGSFWGLSAMLVMFREQGILRRFHAVLKRPGFLCIADLDAEDGSFHGEGFDGHLGFDREQLADKVRAAGFASVRFTTAYEMTKVVAGGKRTFPIFLMVAGTE